MGIIYIHKNYKDNYKIYIGQTICSDLNKRWLNGGGYLSKKKDRSEQGWHYAQPRMAEAVLNSDWKKDWDHDILEDLGDCTKKELDDREAYWISFFDSTNPLRGYNTMKKSKGHGAVSEETKKKLSEINKGKILSEEHKNKISNSNKGHFTSEETKEKISKANKGNKMSEEARKKVSEARKGKPSNNKGHTPSEEARKKMSEAAKKRPSNRKGVKLSDETKKKISEAQRKRRKNEL